jgi:hypothetical protein
VVVDRSSPPIDLGNSDLANVRPVILPLHTAKMTLSSSLSLFRRFSRKNKRQPSEPAPPGFQVEEDVSSSLPHDELSSSYIIATRSTVSTTTTTRQTTFDRDSQDKGDRKRVAETPQEEGDLMSNRKCSRKVAFDEEQVEDRSVVFCLCSLVVTAEADVDHFAGVFLSFDV